MGRIFSCLIGAPSVILLFPAHTAVAAQDIANFKSGRICLNPDSKLKDFGRSEVCLETDEVVIDGQSICLFRGKEAPCTWFGFEFDFTPRLAGKTLRCTINSDIAITYGGPKSITHEDSKSHVFDLVLPKKAGRFFNPQYAVFRSGLRSHKIYEEETSCEFEDEEVLRYRMRFIHPANNQSPGN